MARDERKLCEKLLRAAGGACVAAEALRRSPRSNGCVVLSADRADAIATLLEDTARVFDEMSIELEGI